MTAWANVKTLGSKDYVCGYCGQPLSSEKGYHTNGLERIYICHKCKKPTFFDDLGNQTPGTIYGNSVLDIDDEKVKTLYDETRRCFGNNAYTAIVLCCRKLLMHIAVAKGAKEGKNFIEYVEYLSDNNYIPPDAKSWVDHIRKKGNEANHEIVIMEKEDAKDLLDFVGMLLKIIYEFPANIKKKTKTRESKA